MSKHPRASIRVVLFRQMLTPEQVLSEFDSARNRTEADLVEYGLETYGEGRVIVEPKKMAFTLSWKVRSVTDGLEKA